MSFIKTPLKVGDLVEVWCIKNGIIEGVEVFELVNDTKNDKFGAYVKMSDGGIKYFSEKNITKNY